MGNLFSKNKDSARKDSDTKQPAAAKAKTADKKDDKKVVEEALIAKGNDIDNVAAKPPITADSKADIKDEKKDDIVAEEVKCKIVEEPVIAVVMTDDIALAKPLASETKTDDNKPETVASIDVENVGFKIEDKVEAVTIESVEAQIVNSDNIEGNKDVDEVGGNVGNVENSEFPEGEFQSLLGAICKLMKTPEHLSDLLYCNP